MRLGGYQQVRNGAAASDGRSRQLYCAGPAMALYHDRNRLAAITIAQQQGGSAITAVQCSGKQAAHGPGAQHVPVGLCQWLKRRDGIEN